MQFDDDIRACAELVQRADPDRFQAAMATPLQVRLKLFVLYAFNAEMSRAPWASQESMIAEMRVQWWRDVGAEIAEGKTPRRHYVATPLGQVLSPKLAHEIDTIAEARRWDIYRDPFDDLDALVKYLADTAGNVMWMSAATLGQADEERVHAFGLAHGVASWLRALPELERQNRVPMVDGTLEGVQALAQIGLDALQNSRGASGVVDKEARHALLAGWQSGAILRQALTQPERVAQGALGMSEFRKRLRLMWCSTTGRW
ncbi:squalene/phytoene synthase family protein [Epibacterium ulvae]|uniref:squalene/phytoene synthase family protein n=1 Tax=Epibacterium ulvae TaxID=1156985 RepID=UPI001BFC0234|nr:squalene/phytoene synthase family protein [Epibacterium ulvae]MBT8152432.1 squalene/phytoene synthase family protein [Epibacterium ulvae]